MLFSKILSNYKSTLDSRYLNLILNIQIKLNKATVTNNYFEKILENSNKKSNERKNLRGKVDIIIPIYNSYEYVVRCVESVLKNNQVTIIIYKNNIESDFSFSNIGENSLSNQFGGTSVSEFKLTKWLFT